MILINSYNKDNNVIINIKSFRVIDIIVIYSFIIYIVAIYIIH